MPVEERDAELRAMEEHTKHWEERAIGDREQLRELLEAVEPFTVDGGVGCGSEEVDALVETYDRIRGEQKAGS